MDKPMPAVLYHGSPEALSLLEPRPARGVGPMTDQQHRVELSFGRQFV
jgi:hypothetical protein